MDVVKQVHFDRRDFGQLFEFSMREGKSLSVYLSREAAQSLMDQAYAAGLRPNRSKAKQIHEEAA